MLRKILIVMHGNCGRMQVVVKDPNRIVPHQQIHPYRLPVLLHRTQYRMRFSEDPVFGIKRQRKYRIPSVPLHNHRTIVIG